MKIYDSEEIVRVLAWNVFLFFVIKGRELSPLCANIYYNFCNLHLCKEKKECDLPGKRWDRRYP